VGRNQIYPIEAIQPTVGGITCNVGIALQRLGIPTGLLTLVGNDVWGGLIRAVLEGEGLDTAMLQTHSKDPTTAVVALIDADGERSFLVPEAKTATKSIDQAFVRNRLDAIGKASYFLLGYFGRMPLLEPDLPEVLQDIRATGCRTVMDSAGNGGDPELLRRVLPHLDIYIPSEMEARHQTGETAPEAMVQSYREQNTHGIIGVKLGDQGALLHDPEEGFIRLPAIEPIGPVVDTIGAGDCFMAGFLAGLEHGLPVAEAGRWATAAGASAVTSRGGYAGISNKDALTSMLRGI
jgi:sugar/nucleoside kinase (ribokinase family)